MPTVTGLPGRPRSRPDVLHADKGYDFNRCRRHLPTVRARAKVLGGQVPPMLIYPRRAGFYQPLPVFALEQQMPLYVMPFDLEANVVVRRQPWLDAIWGSTPLARIA